MIALFAATTSIKTVDAFLQQGDSSWRGLRIRSSCLLSSCHSWTPRSLLNQQSRSLQLFHHDDKRGSSITTTTRITRSHESLLFARAALKETSESSNDNNNNTDDSDVTFPLAVLLLSQFLLFVGVGAVIPAIPLYGQEIGLSQAANGVCISAPAVALLLLSKTSGNYSDTAGRKPAMLYGMACIAVADLGTAFARTLPQLILARLALGAGRGVAEAGERGMLADMALRMPEQRGRALALQQAVTALGIAVGAPLGGVVIEEYGPRAAFLCVTAAAVIALLLYTVLPETGMSATIVANNKQKEDDDKSTSTATSAKMEQEEWTTLLADRRWRGLALGQCGTSFGFAAKIASIPILATATLPGGAAGTGFLLSAAGLSGLVGAPVGGFLTDRAGARWTATLSGWISATGLLLIPVVLNSSSTAWAPSWLSLDQLSSLTFDVPFLQDTPVSGDAAAFAALVVLWSLGATAQGPALTAYAQELAPQGSEATALALPRAAGDGTYIVAPFLLGVVADAASGGAIRGAECALAGAAIGLGATVLALSGAPTEDL